MRTLATFGCFEMDGAVAGKIISNLATYEYRVWRLLVIKTEDIVRFLPVEINKPLLVSGVTSEIWQGIDSEQPHPTIVVPTDRKLTLKGGNGKSGLDGEDMENIRRALRRAMRKERGSGFVKNFVVRQKSDYPPGSYDMI